MRLFFTIFWVIFVFVILWIFSLNIGQFITIDLIFVEYEQVNILTAAIILMFTGVFIASAFFISHIYKMKRMNNQLKKSHKALNEELNNLKLQFIEGEKPQQQNDLNVKEENETNDQN